MTTQWFVRHAGKTIGPLSPAELKGLAQRGKLRPDMELRRDTDAQWVPAGRVKNLFPTQNLMPPAPTTTLPAQSPPRPPAFRDPPPTMVQRAEVSTELSRAPCPLCGELIAATAVKCRYCNEYLDGRPSNAPIQPIATPPPQTQVVVNNVNTVQQIVGGGAGPRWNRGIAALLSFLIPGAGQLYKGQIINAVVWFALCVVGYAFLIVPGLILHALCVIGAASGNPYR